MRELVRRGAWVIAPLLFLMMVAVYGGPRGTSTYYLGDFRAFYCAGSAIAHGASPYREEPLRTCEQDAGPPPLPAQLRGVALPAPLPPHALLPFAALSALPFALAGIVYTLLLIAAMSASVVVFARLTGVSTTVLNLTFAPITATVTYFIGQPIPFVFLALAGAALLLRRERWTAAAACAVAATIEPHIALPAMLAMGLFAPRTRLPLVAFGAAATALGALAIGLPETVVYVRDVIPSHALANAYEWQFSLTSVLTSLGVEAHAAIRCGEVMFALMTALGVFAAQRLRVLHGDAALLALVPPAFAVFGGVHVHLQQIAIAFPAVLYVIVRHRQVRALAVSGLAFALVPWHVMSVTVLSGFAPAFSGGFAYAFLGRRAGIAFAVAGGAIVAAVLAAAFAGFGPHDVPFVAHAYPPHALAEESWSAFSRSVLMRPSPLMQWLRVPTFAGLACALASIVQGAFFDAERARGDAAATLRAAAAA